MGAAERVDIGPIKHLLASAAPAKAADLEVLFHRLSPICEIDRNEERVFFQADADRKLIRIGSKCTIRLQAHALSAGVVIAGISTPGFKGMTSEQRRPLFRPADVLLNWAVGRDLQEKLARIEGYRRDLDQIFRGAGGDLPDDLLASLTRQQRIQGEGLFRYATAFILLHELGHLNFGHQACEGYWSIQQEKDADRFAADWLLEAASKKEGRAGRLNVLFGIAVALLWLTVFNVFLGRSESNTHPEGYDRLFQVLDRGVDSGDDPEHQTVWDFVSFMLFLHMDTAGFEFTPEHFRFDDPRDEVNAMIDIISKRKKW